MPTSLDYTAMQEYSKMSAQYVIQDILDEPDFPYKSMGQNCRSRIHTYLTGGGIFFLYE